MNYRGFNKPSDSKLPEAIHQQTNDYFINQFKITPTEQVMPGTPVSSKSTYRSNQNCSKTPITAPKPVSQVKKKRQINRVLDQHVKSIGVQPRPLNSTGVRTAIVSPKKVDLRKTQAIPSSKEPKRLSSPKVKIPTLRLGRNLGSGMALQKVDPKSPSPRKADSPRKVKKDWGKISPIRARNQTVAGKVTNSDQNQYRRSPFQRDPPNHKKSIQPYSKEEASNTFSNARRNESFKDTVVEKRGSMRSFRKPTVPKFERRKEAPEYQSMSMMPESKPLNKENPLDSAKQTSSKFNSRRGSPGTRNMKPTFFQQTVASSLRMRRSTSKNIFEPVSLIAKQSCFQSKQQSLLNVQEHLDPTQMGMFSTELNMESEDQNSPIDDIINLDIVHGIAEANDQVLDLPTDNDDIEGMMQSIDPIEALTDRNNDILHHRYSQQQVINESDLVPSQSIRVTQTSYREQNKQKQQQLNSQRSQSTTNKSSPVRTYFYGKKQYTVPEQTINIMDVQDDSKDEPISQKISPKKTARKINDIVERLSQPKSRQEKIVHRDEKGWASVYTSPREKSSFKAKANKTTPLKATVDNDSQGPISHRQNQLKMNQSQSVSRLSTHKISKHDSIVQDQSPAEQSQYQSRSRSQAKIAFNNDNRLQNKSGINKRVDVRMSLTINQQESTYEILDLKIDNDLTGNVNQSQNQMDTFTSAKKENDSLLEEYMQKRSGQEKIHAWQEQLEQYEKEKEQECSQQLILEEQEPDQDTQQYISQLTGVEIVGLDLGFDNHELMITERSYGVGQIEIQSQRSGSVNQEEEIPENSKTQNFMSFVEEPSIQVTKSQVFQSFDGIDDQSPVKDVLEKDMDIEEVNIEEVKINPLVQQAAEISQEADTQLESLSTGFSQTFKLSQRRFDARQQFQTQLAEMINDTVQAQPQPSRDRKQRRMRASRRATVKPEISQKIQEHPILFESPDVSKVFAQSSIADISLAHTDSVQIYEQESIEESRQSIPCDTNKFDQFLMDTNEISFIKQRPPSSIKDAEDFQTLPKQIDQKILQTTEVSNVIDDFSFLSCLSKQES